MTYIKDMFLDWILIIFQQKLYFNTLALGGEFDDKFHTFIFKVHNFTFYQWWKNISSRFSGKSEAFSSEILETPEEMFLGTICIVISLESPTTHWYVTRRESFKNKIKKNCFIQWYFLCYLTKNVSKRLFFFYITGLL